MAEIIYNTSTREFHLCNQRISYILSVLENGQLGQLYFGKKLTHRDSFAHFIQMRTQSHTAYVYENDFLFSLDTMLLAPLALETDCIPPTSFRRTI